jgi:FkbM family methyltransferase
MLSLSKELDRLKKGWRAFSLYRQCVRPGNLCFDIGANHGSRAVIFTLLGARTIAVEPNDGLTGKLKKFPRVTVVNKAVSDKPGHATMSFNRNDQISSLNPEWRKNWPEFPDWYERQVECVTFDQLIGQYGMPDFCKIDVEGYEASVLSGLTKHVPLLSFEATPGEDSSLQKCLSHLARLGEYEFNFAIGDDFEWLSPKWESADKIVKLITQAGDIYARAKNGR